jgi:hypothetical protein
MTICVVLLDGYSRHSLRDSNLPVGLRLCVGRQAERVVQLYIL